MNQVSQLISEVFSLLNQSPLVSIVAGSVLTLVLMIILKNQIRDLVKKRYGLMSKDEVMAKLTEAVYSDDTIKFEQQVSRNLIPKNQVVLERVLESFRKSL